jgi:glycosyltransferase involved in cell wall biosynthesis
VVEKQVQELGLEGRVRFLGVVPEDIPGLYEGALALVMPTYSESAALAPVEAVTLGCPVIYSDLPGCREQMGDAALYCGLGDASSLANHLVTLIQDSAAIDVLRQAGRKIASEAVKVNYSERPAFVLDNYAYVARIWTSPGTDPPGGQAHVERQVQALGLIERVRFLGTVPDEDIPVLYQGALALVMPAHFAPTSLPPLEAASLGCPVIYSDLPGCREQMGDAALYCDLTNPLSLADKLAALIEDPKILHCVRETGFKLSAEVSKINYGERLAKILDEYAYVQRRWSPLGMVQ